MFKHVVMWNFKESYADLDKLTIIAKVCDSLNDLRPVIPEIKSIEFGRSVEKNPGQYDLVMIMAFDSEADHEIYQNHPEHIKAASFIIGAYLNEACVDFLD